MAMTLTAEGKSAILKSAFQDTPLALHIGLLDTDDVELVGDGYVRQSFTPNDTNWDYAGGLITNKIAVQFPAPTADWHDVKHVGFYDAASGGNLLFRTPLSVVRSILLGDLGPAFAINGLEISLAGV